MPTEIEVKIRVPDHAPIREKLKALQTAAGQVTKETNTLYDHPAVSLRESGKCLRVRHESWLGWEKCIVTYKGPTQPGEFKSREEAEFTVDRPNAFCLMLEGIGFSPSISYLKTRESYLLNGCSVELDTITTLPVPNTFVEIEGPSEQAIRNTLVDLGLEGAEIVKESYPELVEQAGPRRRNGRPAFSLTPPPQSPSL